MKITPWRCILLVVALGLSAASAALANNWPAFRGPSGDGRAEAKGLPVTWTDTDHVHWKTAIHDKGWSSPVVWGEQIWMTTGRVDGKQLFAVCVELGTGKILHDIKVFDVDKPAFCHPFNSYASSTPALEKGRIYVHFGTHGTACLDTATGKVLWERRDLKCDHFRGAGSSPILHDNLLFLLFDGVDVDYVVALDKETGKTVWKKDRAIEYKPSKDGDDRKAYATPAVFTIDGKPQLICPAALATIAYNPANGEELWRVANDGMNAACRPILANNLIYLTTGYKPLLQAVRPGGKGDVTKSHVQWTARKGMPTRPSILVVGDLIFTISDDGIASCLDAKTGEQIWQERVGGSYSASPLEADGRIYMCDQDGTTTVIEAGRKYKKLATNKLPDGCMASPAATGKSLLVRTKTHLYCLEQR